MTDFIIIGIVVILIFAGIHSGTKHFRGEGGCCGGGSTYKMPKKKLKHIIEKKTLKVEGMSCQNCKNRVEEAVNDLDGVSGSVDLKKGIVVVSYEQKMDDAIVKKAIEKAGYKVTEIN